MSAFSNLDASSNAAALLDYLDETDRSLSAMKAYVAATAVRHAFGQPVLDLGCGVGHDLARLANVGASPVGLDISAAALARAQVLGHPVVQGDGARLPFRTGVFAGCRVERVLQHVREPGDVVAEIARVVRPGGLVAIFEPDHTTFRVESNVMPDGMPLGRFLTVRHPSIGAQAADLLRLHGCSVVDIVTEKSFAYRRAALPFNAVVLTQQGVDAGVLTPELRVAWLEEQQERERAGTFRASWSKVLTVARTYPAVDRMPSPAETDGADSRTPVSTS